MAMEYQKEISVNGKTIVIKKIPLGKYPRLIEIVKTLLQHKDLVKGTSNAEIIAALPDILIVAAPEMVKLMQVITDEPAEDVATYGGDDFVRILEATFAVNDYEYIYKTLKKAMGSIKVRDVHSPEALKQAAQDAAETIGTQSESGQ